MNLTRRGFFAGLVAAWGVFKSKPGVADPVQAAPPIIEPTSVRGLKFYAYLSPDLVGWKGYWFDPATHEIVAFESLDGKKFATPWALMLPSHRYIPTMVDARSGERTERPLIEYDDQEVRGTGL